MAGSGVWQDCHSLPTRTLHQQVDLTLASKKHHLHSLHEAILSIVASSSCIGGVVHPHAGVVALFILTHRIFLVLLTQ